MQKVAKAGAKARAKAKADGGISPPKGPKWMFFILPFSPARWFQTAKEIAFLPLQFFLLQLLLLHLPSFCELVIQCIT